MANRVPLIINTTANQIQELAVGDCLDLTASGISNAGVITATKFVGDGSLLTNLAGVSALSDVADDITPQLGGNLDINGKIVNGSGSIVITGGIQATSFTGSVVGDVTGNVSGSAGSASGLTGNPAIQVASIVATGHIQADTVSVASTLTYEDVTNIDSVGVVTARTGIKVLAGGINAVGVVTATSFNASLAASNLTGALPAISGANLTNLPASGLTDIVEDTTPQLGGDLDLNSKSILGTTNIKVDAPSGAGVQVMLSNNATAGNGTTPDVSVLGFASGGSLKASIRAAVYGEGWMSFHNNNDSEKMRLTAAGALGIGTVSPSAYLDVESNASSGNVAEFRSVHESNSARILVDSPADNNIRPSSIVLANAGTDKWGIGQVYASSSSGAFHICAGSASEANSKLTINTSGLVGIATAAPADAWLDIASSAGTDSLRMRRISDDVNVASNWSLKPYGKNLYFREGASSPYDRVHFTDTGNVVTTVGEFQDSKGSLRSLPRNEPSGAYTAATSDKGKFISSGSDVTFDNSATWNTGDAITIFNYNASSTIQIISGTGVLIHFTDGSTASTGTRVLAAKGVCTLLCVEGSNNTFVISGALT